MMTPAERNALPEIIKHTASPLELVVALGFLNPSVLEEDEEIADADLDNDGEV